MKQQQTWWEEFKDSGLFHRFLLLFHYLLALTALGMFAKEFIKTL